MGSGKFKSAERLKKILIKCEGSDFKTDESLGYLPKSTPNNRVIKMGF